MGGGGGGSGRTEIRYADYVEDRHQDFLDDVSDYRHTVADASPYSGYADFEIDDAFFGAGYVFSSFPSLYDMYGKFMAGLDVEVLFDQAFEESTDGAVIHNLINAQAVELSDDLENVATPRFVTGMRDINSVITSSFVVGKAMMEVARQKELNKFAAELRYRMIPVAVERWRTHLDWNKSVTTAYAEIMKLYISAKMDTDNHNYDYAARNALWPFTVLEFERAALGALQGAQTTSTKPAGGSDTQRALGGAMAGAAAGYMVGNAPGAVVGGILGLAYGLFG